MAHPLGMHSNRSTVFSTGCGMVFYFPAIWYSVFPFCVTSDFLHAPLKRSSLCSSCGHCHCHPGSLPFIVPHYNTGDDLAPGGRPCNHEERVIMRTYMNVLWWFMLGAVKTASKKQTGDAQLCVHILLRAGFVIFPGQQHCHTGEELCKTCDSYDSSLCSHCLVTFSLMFISAFHLLCDFTHSIASFVFYHCTMQTYHGKQLSPMLHRFSQGY